MKVWAIVGVAGVFAAGVALGLVMGQAKEERVAEQMAREVREALAREREQASRSVADPAAAAMVKEVRVGPDPGPTDGSVVPPAQRPSKAVAPVKPLARPVQGSAAVPFRASGDAGASRQRAIASSTAAEAYALVMERTGDRKLARDVWEVVEWEALRDLEPEGKPPKAWGATTRAAAMASTRPVDRSRMR